MSDHSESWSDNIHNWTDIHSTHKGLYIYMPLVHMIVTEVVVLVHMTVLVVYAYVP